MKIFNKKNYFLYLLFLGICSCSQTNLYQNKNSTLNVISMSKEYSLGKVSTSDSICSTLAHPFFNETEQEITVAKEQIPLLNERFKFFNFPDEAKFTYESSKVVENNLSECLLKIQKADFKKYSKVLDFFDISISKGGLCLIFNGVKNAFRVVEDPNLSCIIISDIIHLNDSDRFNYPLYWLLIDEQHIHLKYFLDKFESERIKQKENQDEALKENQRKLSDFYDEIGKR